MLVDPTALAAYDISQLVSLALLPVWLELTAPLLLAFGLAPPRRRKDEDSSVQL